MTHLRLARAHFLALLLPLSAHGASDTTVAISSRAADPLLYAHIVIDCTIESVRHAAVTNEQLSIPSREPEKKVGILIAKLSNTLVLRGKQAPSEITIGLDLDPRSLVGKRVLLCGYWLPNLGMFAVWFDNLGFVRSGERWVSLKHAATVEPADRFSLTTEQVNVLLEEVTAVQLAQRAGKIVIGRVTIATDTVMVLAGDRYKMKNLVLDVETVLKGDRSSRTVSIMVPRGYAFPAWGAVSPRQFELGETWVAFLGHEDGVFFPLAGVNGLLLCDGNRLLFDRIVEYRQSRSELVRSIAEVAND